MSDAIWYVVEPSIYFVAGALLAFYFLIAFVLLCVGGIYQQRFRLWTQKRFSQFAGDD